MKRKKIARLVKKKYRYNKSKNKKKGKKGKKEQNKRCK